MTTHTKPKAEKKDDYCKCLNSNTFISLGGTINRLTPEGVETTTVKGDKPRCVNCKKYKKI